MIDFEDLKFEHPSNCEYIALKLLLSNLYDNQSNQKLKCLLILIIYF